MHPPPRSSQRAKRRRERGIGPCPSSARTSRSIRSARLADNDCTSPPRGRSRRLHQLRTAGRPDDGRRAGQGGLTMSRVWVAGLFSAVMPLTEFTVLLLAHRRDRSCSRLAAQPNERTLREHQRGHARPPAIAPDRRFASLSQAFSRSRSGVRVRSRSRSTAPGLRRPERHSFAAPLGRNPATGNLRHGELSV
jgi:hypothetical protein